MVKYYNTATQTDANRQDVCKWIYAELHITPAEDLDDELLLQTPFRRLVVNDEIALEPWQDMEVVHTEDGATITRSYIAVDVPLEEFAAHRKAAIAAARWQAQNAGINIGGVDIDTGNDTALYISAALQKLPANPSMTLSWKTKAGTFVSLGATELTVIGDAIFEHVQDCFGTEKDRIEAIDEIVADSELTDQQKLASISAVTWDDPS